MTTNQNYFDGQQVDALTAIMLKELRQPLSTGQPLTAHEILTMATNMVTDYRVRVLEPPFRAAPSTEVQTAVKAEEPLKCEICNVYKRNHRWSSHPFLPPKAEEPRPFTSAAYAAMEDSRADMTAPKITRDMLERPANPEPVAKGFAERIGASSRRVGETPPGYAHTDAYAFSRARKAELEAEKGRLITVRELTNQDLGKHIVVTLTDGHQIAGTLTYMEIVSELVHRLRLADATWSKVPGDKGLRTLKVNTDRPVRVTDR